MQKTIILDLGNVLVSVDFKKFHDKLKSVLSFSYTETLKKMDPLMAEFNKGVINPDNFYKQCCRLLKLNVDYTFFTRAWVEIFGANSELLTFLNKLPKENLQIVLASNTDELHYEYISKKFQLSFLDKQYLSYENGVIKPDPNFFHQLLKKYDLQAENCIFFDDLSDNVSSAASCGIKALQHTDNQTTISAIKEFINQP